MADVSTALNWKALVNCFEMHLDSNRMLLYGEEENVGTSVAIHVLLLLLLLTVKSLLSRQNLIP